MLELLNISDFDKIYPVFEESFPIDERRPYEAQKALLSRDEFKILVYCEEGEIKGFISIYELDDIIFAEHFAIEKKYRNQGLGSIILGQLQGMTDKEICLEVEPPDTDIAKRRISFYERNGFYYNDQHYTQPPLFEGQGEVELKLMTTKRTITEKEFENIRDIIYKEVYRKRIL